MPCRMDFITLLHLQKWQDSFSGAWQRPSTIKFNLLRCEYPLMWRGHVRTLSAQF